MPSYKVAFFASLGFVLGIAAGSGFIKPIIFTSYTALFLLGFWYWLSRKNPKGVIFLSLITIIGVVLGIIYFNLRNSCLPNSLYGQTEFLGEINGIPVKKSGRQIFEVLSDDKQKIIIETSAYRMFDYQDRVRVSGFFENGSGEIMVKDAKVTLTDKRPSLYGMAILYRFREYLLKNIDQSLYGDEAELAKGVIMGDQSGFSFDFKNAMKLSGTTHLVALSGYNITIIASAALLFFKLFFSRKPAFFAAVLAILLFVLMAGGSPSLIRAMIMAYIAILGKATGRIYDASHALVMTAGIMAFVDPWIVINDIGFELSFAATLGIIVIAPKLIKKFNIKDGPQRLAIESLAAQGAAFPIIITRFGYMNWLAFIPNVLISYLMPLSMGLGATIAIFGRSLGVASWILAYVTQMIFAYEVKVINLFAFNI